METLEQYWTRSEQNRLRTAALAKAAQQTPEAALAVRQQQQQATRPFMDMVARLMGKGHTWREALDIIERDEPALFRAMFDSTEAAVDKRNGMVAIRKQAGADVQQTVRDAAWQALERAGAVIAKRDGLTVEQGIAQAVTTPGGRELHQLYEDPHAGLTVAEYDAHQQTLAKRRASFNGAEGWDGVVDVLAKSFVAAEGISYTQALDRVRQLAPNTWDAYQRGEV